MNPIDDDVIVVNLLKKKTQTTVDCCYLKKWKESTRVAFPHVADVIKR